jgi:hypothetical protein
MRRGYDQFNELQASCLEEGLLARGLGGALRITKKGREAVKLAAIHDGEVASALEEALGTPWLERREALLALLLYARERLPPTNP